MLLIINLKIIKYSINDYLYIFNRNLLYVNIYSFTFLRLLNK